MSFKGTIKNKRQKIDLNKYSENKEIRKKAKLKWKSVMLSIYVNYAYSFHVKKISIDVRLLFDKFNL